MPPQKKMRSDAIAAGRPAAVSSSWRRNGVAPPVTVHRFFSMQSIPSSALQTSISTLVAPLTHGMSKAQYAPVMCVTGEGMKTTSDGPIDQASRIERTR